MKKLLVLFVFLFLASASIFALGRSEKGLVLYGGYEASVNGETDAIQDVFGGFSGRTQIFMDLFFYSDVQAGYAFDYPNIFEHPEDSIRFTGGLALGAAWRFHLTESLKLLVGGGINGYLYADVNGPEALGFMRIDIGLDLLAELQYYFSRSWYLTASFKPGIYFYSLDYAIGPYSEALVGIDRVGFNPQIKLGIGCRWGRFE